MTARIPFLQFHVDQTYSICVGYNMSSDEYLYKSYIYKESFLCGNNVFYIFFLKEDARYYAYSIRINRMVDTVLYSMDCVAVQPNLGHVKDAIRSEVCNGKYCCV